MQVRVGRSRDPFAVLREPLGGYVCLFTPHALNHCDDDVDDA